MTKEPQPIGAAPAAVVTVKKGTDRSGPLLVLAAFVAIGGVTFAIGRATAPASSGGAQTGIRVALPGASFDPSASFDPATMGRPGGGSMTVTGTVAAVSGSILTITTPDGRAISIDASGATWHRQAAAISADVTTGTTVQVTTSGLGGFGPGEAAPGASPVPGASAAPGASVAPGGAAAPAASAAPTTVTATDVTIVTP